MNKPTQLALTLSMGLVIALPALWLGAQEAGEIVIKRGTVSEDLYAAGQTVEIAAQVDGDVVVAGQRVTVDESVSGDVMAAGEIVTISARVADDVRAAGRVVTIDGSVADHVVAAGETVILKGRGSIGTWTWLAGRQIEIFGDVGTHLKATGQVVVIGGDIKGDVDVSAEELRVLATAAIGGNLTYRSTEAADIHPGARIAGQVVHEPAPEHAPAETEIAKVVAGVALLFGLGLIVAGVVFYLVFPKFSLAAARRVASAPLPALGLGVAVLVATPPVVGFLMISVLGWVVGLAMGALYLLTALSGLLTGVLFGADFALRRMLKRDQTSKAARAVTIAAAFIVLALLQMIPVLGWLLVLFLLLAGVGALMLELWACYRASEAQGS